MLCNNANIAHNLISDDKRYNKPQKVYLLLWDWQVYRIVQVIKWKVQISFPKRLVKHLATLAIHNLSKTQISQKTKIKLFVFLSNIWCATTYDKGFIGIEFHDPIQSKNTNKYSSDSYYSIHTLCNKFITSIFTSFCVFIVMNKSNPSYLLSCYILKFNVFYIILCFSYFMLVLLLISLFKCVNKWIGSNSSGWKQARTQDNMFWKIKVWFWAKDLRWEPRNHA